MMVGRNPTPGAFYPTTAAFGAITSASPTNNESLDMNEWDNHEFRTFLKWFIEANHPEAVKEYQAVRAIERKVEFEEANRRHREQLEAEIKMREAYLARQAQGMQNAYPYSQSPYATTATQSLATAESKSFWEQCKELARRPLGHGDYY